MNDDKEGIDVEGKSYATGKTVFEAQNQASVSGSCINNQQHQLANFTKRASAGSSHSKVLPTGFSISALKEEGLLAVCLENDDEDKNYAVWTISSDLSSPSTIIMNLIHYREYVSKKSNALIVY